MEPHIIHKKVILRARKHHPCDASIAIMNMGTDYFDFDPKLKRLVEHLINTRSPIKSGCSYVRYVVKDGGSVHTFKAGLAIDYICRQYGVYEENA